jgi:hypothetical protein
MSYPYCFSTFKVVLGKSDVVNLELFAKTYGVSVDDAVEMILHRYFSLSYRQREQVEAKLFWITHRNKGFRSLPQFLKEPTNKPQKRKPYNPNLPKKLTKPKHQQLKKPKQETKETAYHV